MRIVRKNTQNVLIRHEDNRQVRFVFNEAVNCLDWLTVTESKQYDHKRDVGIRLHRHPNATEMIIFLKHAFLQVNKERYAFYSGDIAILDPEDTHGAKNLNNHDCICILMGKGKLRKRSYESQNSIT